MYACLLFVSMWLVTVSLCVSVCVCCTSLSVKNVCMFALWSFLFDGIILIGKHGTESLLSWHAMQAVSTDIDRHKLFYQTSSGLSKMAHPCLLLNGIWKELSLWLISSAEQCCLSSDHVSWRVPPSEFASVVLDGYLSHFRCAKWSLGFLRWAWFGLSVLHTRL